MTDLPDRLPRHVAIIVDGNGRWAKRRGLPRTKGHQAGVEALKIIAQACADWNVPVLTLYLFSTENWRRPRSEVRFLMALLRRFLKEYRPELIKNDVRLRAIGALDGLPAALRKELARTLEQTRGGQALTVVAALNYGAHREIADAVRAIARKVEQGELTPEEVDEALIEEHLYTAGLPAPDLLIRTGGEMRVSNFLLWQISYAELYVTDTLWPDFGLEEFGEALREFARRRRRFGGLDEGD